ncbi:MAG: phosphoribosylanthranilate isomerase [Erysipelotrichaceae bacterium]|nr:phosphoribosylanthranilate isomerase [Erysipelotrichaceae bacterium]
MTQIKICGLFRDCDIDYVNEAGSDYAGFIISFPRSHRSIDPAEAARLRKKLNPEIKAVGVFVDQPRQYVQKAAREIGLDVIQLHGHEDDDYIEEIRSQTGLVIWKAFKIREPQDLAAASASKADMVLLDNGYGTGKQFDWSLLDGFDRPFILAGGLREENIPEAIRMFDPRVLDVSSGVETDKLKDREKILAAVRAAHDKRMEGEIA